MPLPFNFAKGGGDFFKIFEVIVGCFFCCALSVVCFSLGGLFPRPFPIAIALILLGRLVFEF